MTTEMLERCCAAYWNVTGPSKWQDEAPSLKNLVRFRMKAALEELKEPSNDMIAVVIPPGTQFPAQHFWRAMLERAIHGAPKVIDG